MSPRLMKQSFLAQWTMRLPARKAHLFPTLCRFLTTNRNKLGFFFDILFAKHCANEDLGKSVVMRRFHARGRGRSARIEKWFSHLKIVVSETSNEVPAESVAAGEAA